MSMSYSPNINNIKPYHNNENFPPQQQAQIYTPFIQEPVQEQFNMTQQPQPQQQPPMQNFQQPPPQQYPSNYMTSQPYNKNKYDNYLNPPVTNESSKINWIIILKSIAIYTILFLIISSVKMDDFLYSMIPYLSTNEISKMILKGLVYGILVIVIQRVIS